VRVGLFIPCYVDQFYPHVGLATLHVLRNLDLNVEFPSAQTCCGQPMANSGCVKDAHLLAEHFLDVFGGFDHVVAPSGSCVSMVRNHYEQWFSQDWRYQHLRENTFEFCEYLTDIVGIKKVGGEFNSCIGLHQSCHGLRELRLARSSEIIGSDFNKAKGLLSQLRGITLKELARPDECCGFGGTFAVNEEVVSCLMGRDRIADHENAGVEIIVGFDMSCLMHLEGLIKRAGKSLRVMHVAELLESARLS